MAAIPQFITIPSEILERIGKDEQEIKIELAIFFYKDFNLSASKAAEFAGINRLAFWKELGNRQIPLNYDEEDAQHDVEVINEFNKTHV